MVYAIDRVLKRLLDNRFYWNVIEGPLYNMLIYRSLDKGYDAFLRTLSIAPAAKVLDVGSGAGQATLRLATRYPETSVFGIDYAFIQVHIAQLCKRYRKVHNIEFRIGDALHVPFRDGTFDIVVSLGSIKHWSEVRRGFAEIHRVLRSGGFAHIIECDPDATREQIAELAGRAAWFFPLRQAIAWYQEHVVFGQGPERDEVSVLAQEVGFGEVIVKRMKELPFFHMTLRK
jgi:ubiquinone/menaquinone biosynthesis C-methylase UbiE